MKQQEKRKPVAVTVAVVVICAGFGVLVVYGIAVLVSALWKYL